MLVGSTGGQAAGFCCFKGGEKEGEGRKYGW